MADSVSLYPRGISKALQEALGDTPVVALLGPRQSGKSTLVESLTPARAYVTLDDDQTPQTCCFSRRSRIRWPDGSSSFTCIRWPSLRRRASLAGC